MSIDSKRTLLSNIQNILADKMTATDLAGVIDEISMELSHYHVERNAEEDSGYEFNEMLEAYLSTKQIEGCSKNTIKHYRCVLSRFRDSVNIPIRSITVFTIRNYLAKERERGLSDRSLEGYRQTFSSFFNWLQKEGLLSGNPCNNLGSIKYQKKVLTPYSDVDLECLKECCQNTRDRAIVHFLLSTGCRVSEVCALNRNDVDFVSLECKVLGKGNKERVVYLDPVAAMYIQRYFAERKDDSVALFAGKGSTRLSDNGIRDMLKRTAKLASIEKVHPHRFRRTLATNLIDHGMDIQNVKTILGHESINTTMTYVYIDKSNLKSAYRKYA